MDLQKANEGLIMFHENYCADDTVNCDECPFNEDGFCMMCEVALILRNIMIEKQLKKAIKED